MTTLQWRCLRMIQQIGPMHGPALAVILHERVNKVAFALADLYQDGYVNLNESPKWTITRNGESRLIQETKNREGV